MQMHLYLERVSNTFYFKYLSKANSNCLRILWRTFIHFISVLILLGVKGGGGGYIHPHFSPKYVSIKLFGNLINFSSWIFSVQDLNVHLI